MDKIPGVVVVTTPDVTTSSRVVVASPGTLVMVVEGGFVV